MNDIKTIEELRAYHERLKGVLTALQRLEKGTNQRIKLHSLKSTTSTDGSRLTTNEF